MSKGCLREGASEALGMQRRGGCGVAWCPPDGPLLDISGHSANVHSGEPLPPPRPLPAPRQDVQICFDFTKGRCSRRNCKFSHDIGAIIKYNSREQGICFDFLRGECNRGPLCRFSHDLTRVVSQWMIELQDAPHSRPPPRGICYDFVRGQCPRGRNCRFSHDLLEIAIATSRALANSNSEQNQWGTIAFNAIQRCLSSSGMSTPEPSRASQDDANDYLDAASCESVATPPSKLEDSRATPAPLIRSPPHSIWHEPSISMWSSLPSSGFDVETTTPPKNYLSNVRIRKLLGTDLCSTL